MADQITKKSREIATYMKTNGAELSKFCEDTMKYNKERLYLLVNPVWPNQVLPMPKGCRISIYQTGNSDAIDLSRVISMFIVFLLT